MRYFSLPWVFSICYLSVAAGFRSASSFTESLSQTARRGWHTRKHRPLASKNKNDLDPDRFLADEQPTDTVNVFSFARFFDKLKQGNKKTPERYVRSYVARKELYEDLLNRSSSSPFNLTDIMFTSPGKSSTILSFGRFTVIGSSFAMFPYIVQALIPIADSRADGVVAVTGAVLPGIGILFGSLISITYSILLSRLSNLQDLASKETAKLALLTHDINAILSANADPRRAAALECIKNHANVLIFESRASELLMLMNNRDPLLQLQAIVNDISTTPCSKDSCYVERTGERRVATKVTEGSNQIVDVWPLRTTLSG